MGMIVRFEFGSRQFDLNDERIGVGEGFVPPTTVVRRVLSQGEFAAQVEDEQFEPRSWEFTVHVKVERETEAMRILEALQTFLNYAGKAKAPLYFAFREWGSDFPFEPSWGQFGALKRFRVLQGEVSFGQMYSSIYDGGLFACPVRLMIDPFAYGLWQPLATAGGGIFEEWAGRNGQSVGVRVASNPSGVENHFLNPVFGHSTWNTGWTAALSVAASQNTEDAFRLFGFSSARLVCLGATNNTFTQSINVGNTNTHAISCYARLRDQGAINSAVMSLTYGGSIVTTRYLALEDGWYFLHGLVTGIASAQASGVILANGVEVFVDGFQLEASTFANPLVYGDLPGASWSGTAHNSTTTGAGAGKLQVVTTRWQGEGAIQFVVQCMARSGDMGNGSYYLLQDSGGLLALTYDKTNGRWTLTDGSVSINSSATFNEGDVFVFHATWIQGTLSFYVNGALAGTATYTLPASEPSSIYLGSTNASGSQGPWVLLGFDVYGVAMTAADVTTFYNQVAGILFQAGTTTEDVIERISPIPHLWTKDGDNIVDNCDDSTRDNWGLIGGVGGSAEAETEWAITPSVAKVGYWMMRANFAYGKFQHPSREWYQDLSGAVDTNASGGAAQTQSVTTSGVTFGGGSLGLADDALIEGAVDIFARVRRSTAGTTDFLIQGSFYPVGAGGRAVKTDERRITVDENYRWFYVGRVYAEPPRIVEDRNRDVSWDVRMKALSGTVSVLVDYILAVNGVALRIIDEFNALGDSFSVDGRDVFTTTAGVLRDTFISIGDGVLLMPEQHNLVWYVAGDDGDTHVITQTGTFSTKRVRPRWVLQ